MAQLGPTLAAAAALPPDPQGLGDMPAAPGLPVTTTPLKQFRAQYPMYDSMPDAELASKLYAKHYADAMSEPEFNAKIGLTVDPGAAGSAAIGVLHGVSAGWDDELAGQAAATMAAHPWMKYFPVPGVLIQGALYDAATGNKTGAAAGQAATGIVRNLNAAAWENHPYFYGGGTVAGGIGSAAVAPEFGIASKVLGVGKVGLKAAAIRGGIGGAGWGAADAAGNADPTASTSVSDALAQRAEAGAVGGATGLALGPVLGAGAGVAANVAGPLIQGAAAAARPGFSGLRLMAGTLSRDGISMPNMVARMTPDVPGVDPAVVDSVLTAAAKPGLSPIDPAAIAQSTGADPAHVASVLDAFQKQIAPRYDNTTFLEAAGAPFGNEVVRTPNTMALVKDAANSPSEGQARLMTELRQRQADTPDVAETAIDNHFGSGNFDQQVEDLHQAGVNAFKGRYGELYNQPIMDASAVKHLTDDPAFASALNFAKRQAVVDGEPVPDINALTPKSVDMIQRQLRIAGEATSDGKATPEARLASNIRQHFLTIADNHLDGFAELRGHYANQMAQEDAMQFGRALGVKGNSAAKELQFLDKAQQTARLTSRRLDAAKADLFQARLDPSQAWRSVPALEAALASAQTDATRAAAVGDMFRRGYGQGLKDILANTKDANGLLGALEKQKAATRIRQILPKDAADSFMGIAKSLTQQRDQLNSVYGGSDTAYKTANKGRFQAALKTGASLLTGHLGDASKNARDVVMLGLDEHRNHAIAMVNRPQNALAHRARANALARLSTAQGNALAPLLPAAVGSAGAGANALIQDRKY